MKYITPITKRLGPLSHTGTVKPSHRTIHQIVDTQVTQKKSCDSQISQHVGKVTFNDDGSFHIQLAGDSSEEGVLIFSPEEKGDAQISFSCHSSEVPTEYIPKDCVKEDG